MYTLDKVLKDSVAAHASDIHFTVGCSPFFRIDGMLIPQEGEKLMPKDMEELLLPILDQRHRKELDSGGGTGTDSETAGARSSNRTDGKRQVYDTGIFGGYYQPHVSVSYYYIGGSD